MLKLVVLLACLGLVLCGHSRRDASGTCKSYKTYIHPLIDSGDVTGLQEAFKVMNDKKRAVQTFRLAPIEDSIWPETTAIKMLISLSKPLADTIAFTDWWPENNNIKLGATGASETFNPNTSFFGGIRYIYNCATLQEKACFQKGCKYDPIKPILVAKRNEDIYVPMENFVAANGDAMSNHIEANNNDRTYLIKGFSKLSVRECSARRVFFNSTASVDDCFNNLKFFSLPEALESRSMPEDDTAYESARRKSAEPRRRLMVKKAFFAVMS